MSKKKIAILFPGQGSQYIGMGSDFYSVFYEMINSYYKKSGEILGYDAKKLIFEGPQELLTQTEYTQPLVFLTSYIIFKCIEHTFPEITNYIKYVAGHSLGEYTAVCVSGAIDFENTLTLVADRGKFMSEASKKKPGSMIAALGNIKREEIYSLCEEVKKEGFIVEPVNFNTPQQIVLAGDIKGIEIMQNKLSEVKIKTIKLNVSGAFHSSIMNEAQKNFSLTLDKIIINNAFIPIIMNYDAKPHIEKNEIRENLRQQINHPVLWVDSISYMIDDGIDIFVEIGPGKIISGMLKKIDETKPVVSFEKYDTFKQNIDIMKNLLQ
ncbi:MAG: ACP S-malonyltransferase [Endomicrobia bacterium]|nr:ACP S-malonyltransferase [Endomicrobiia bacterium]